MTEPHARKNDFEVHELRTEVERHVSEERMRDQQMAANIARLESIVTDLSKQIGGHFLEDAKMTANLASAHEETTELTAKITELVAMWEQAKGAVTFMKILATIVTMGAAAWAWISHNVTIAAK